MTKEEVFDKRLYRKAFYLIRTVKNINITLAHVSYSKTGLDIIIRDEKLYNLTRKSSDSDFTVEIKSDFFKDTTLMADLIGKIPSDLDLENRIILRIAWKIWIKFNANILDAYRNARQPDWPELTHYNAKKWYNSLN